MPSGNDVWVGVTGQLRFGGNIKARGEPASLAHLNSPTANISCTPLSTIMVVWSVLALAFVFALTDAIPPSNITTVGSLKLATAADCAGVVAFSAIKGSCKDTKIILAKTLVDKGIGYAAETGIFTAHCPGLYQFSFSGYGTRDLVLSLKLKDLKSDTWKEIIHVGPGGGSNVVLLDVETGDQLAVFVDVGDVEEDEATFSGHRVAKI